MKVINIHEIWLFHSKEKIVLTFMQSDYIVAVSEYDKSARI